MDVVEVGTTEPLQLPQVTLQCVCICSRSAVSEK